LELLSPAEDFFWEWDSSFCIRTTSSLSTGSKPTLQPHSEKGERHKMIFAKLDVKEKKNRPLSKNNPNDPSFIITRKLHL